MKRTIFFLAAILLAVPTLATAAGSAGPTIVMGDAVKWQAGTGEMKGLSFVILSGNPEKKGSLYAMRIKFPDGYKFPPHSHGLEEQVTVISGAFLVGLGSKMDASKMKELGPGSYVDVPAKIVHYAWSKGETVVELHGIGPDTTAMADGSKMKM